VGEGAGAERAKASVAPLGGRHFAAGGRFLTSARRRTCRSSGSAAARGRTSTRRKRRRGRGSAAARGRTSTSTWDGKKDNRGRRSPPLLVIGGRQAGRCCC